MDFELAKQRWGDERKACFPQRGLSERTEKAAEREVAEEAAMEFIGSVAEREWRERGIRLMMMIKDDVDRWDFPSN